MMLGAMSVPRYTKLPGSLPGHHGWRDTNGVWCGCWNSSHPRAAGEGPAAYRLLPTLAVTEALLSTLRNGTAAAVSPQRLAAAADTGLTALRDLCSTGGWPDTAAIEILVPDLVLLINEHLNQSEVAAQHRLGPWARGQRLPQPCGFQAALPERIAERCRAAGGVPLKLHHTFEGIARHLRRMVPSVPGGLLGSSPPPPPPGLPPEPTPAGNKRSPH